MEQSSWQSGVEQFVQPLGEWSQAAREEGWSGSQDSWWTRAAGRAEQPTEQAELSCLRGRLVEAAPYEEAGRLAPKPRKVPLSTQAGEGDLCKETLELWGCTVPGQRLLGLWVIWGLLDSRAQREGHGPICWSGSLLTV